MKKLQLNESFISRIWMNPSYYGGLQTTEGKPVEVLSYGNPNYDSGADFSGSMVKIGGILYSGDVEIHCSVKDWKLHKHTGNRRYNKVILNVVLWGDDSEGNKASTVKRNIPTVILSEYLSMSIHEIWKDIINNPSPSFSLPCSEKSSRADAFLRKDWINDLGMERLRYRAGRIKQRMQSLENEISSLAKKDVWEKALLEFVYEALGFSKNKNQFLKLSRILDLEKIKNNCSTRDDIDAVLYGCSGLLSNDKGAYVYKIKSKWSMLHKELRFETMDRSEWNYFRLRPVNFPTLRVAYASGFTYELLYGELFKRLVFCFRNSLNPLKDISGILSGIEYSEYWTTHYDFGKESKTVKALAGKSRIEDIITNVIMPIVYVYSREFKDDDLFVKMKNVYRTAEHKSDNIILKLMKQQLGLSPVTICESQGVIHLHNFYCTKEKCSECKIGEKVFDKFSVSESAEIIY
jgi:hypothetical protein